MSDVVCVTNRKLCRTDFLTRVHDIARIHPRAIMLREKDLTPEEYESLAEAVINICKAEKVLCIVHNFPAAASAIGSAALHMPLGALREMGPKLRGKFQILGASCHSVSDAELAESLGCTYITFGHVFETNSKPGAPPRGLELLRQVCGSVRIPVFAIGGINSVKIGSVRACGAAGACVMSGFMTCDNVFSYREEFGG